MPYSSMEDVNPSLKGIKPPITLAQANAIARQADGLEKSGSVDSPWGVAIASFKESHKIENGKWVRKKGSEYGKKKKAIEDGTFQCECLECGYAMDSKEHCADIECPECGGTMRRADRPGVGKKEYKLELAEHVGDSAPRLKARLAIDGVIYDTKEVEISKDLLTGCKALEGPNGEPFIVLWTSNAFKDRELETFETKAWKEYVDRADRVASRIGTLAGERGRVDWWHVPNTEFATVVWQGVQGRMLVELAAIDNTDYGTKMYHAIQHPEEYPEVLPWGMSTSHEFLYRPGDKKDKVFSWVHKYKSTVLPYHRASNPYGAVIHMIGGDLKMSVAQKEVTQEKLDGLAALVGPETAKELLQTAKEASDLLEGNGVAFKEKKAPPVPPEEDEEDMEEETEEEKGASKELDQVFEMELDEPLLKEIAQHVDVAGQVKSVLAEILPSALKEFQDTLMVAVKEVVTGTKEQLVKEAISGKIRLTPHVASAAKETIVPPEIREALDTQKEEKGKKDDVVHNLVQGMINHTI